MVELVDADCLPVCEVVTLLAVRTQTSLMLILMAGRACGRQAKIGAAEILDSDGCALLCGNVRRIMALGAFQSCVLAFEQVAGVLMIESLDVPLDQREIFSVVLGVTPSAFLAGSG